MSLTDDARLVVDDFAKFVDGLSYYAPNPEAVKASVRLATAYIEAGRVDGGGCLTCGGCGSVDSGGFTPYGSPIDVPCPDCGTEDKDRQIAILTARLATVSAERDSLQIMCGLTDKDRHVLLQERVAIRELIGIEPFDDDTPIIEAIRELKRKSGGE